MGFKENRPDSNVAVYFDELSVNLGLTMTFWGVVVGLKENRPDANVVLRRGSA